MRRLLLSVSLLPVVLFGFGSDALAGQTDGENGEGGREFTAALSGANEVPPAVGSDLTGTAEVTINLGQHELCWDLDYTTSQKVVAAHIHRGAAGVSGPIVFGFFNPPPSTTVVNSGCREADRALLKQIAHHPGDYYVNVHTTRFPGGAGRGQLTKDS
jgi:hypothetical protein